MLYKTYSTWQKLRQKSYDEFQKGNIFYAYNDEQFNEGMKSVGLNPEDTDKIYRLFPGAYILRSKSKEYHKLANKMEAEFKENMQNFDFAKDAFACELADHEYIVTYDFTDALEALGLTLDEVIKNPMLSKALTEARDEYIKWHEEREEERYKEERANG